MNRHVVGTVAVIAALAGAIAVNAAAVLIPLNGRDTGEIAFQFPVVFQPAGFTFSIWSVIYLLLGAYAIIRAVPSLARSADLGRVDALFVGSSILNGLWLVLWHYEQFVATLVVMVALLLVLIRIYGVLGIGTTSPSSTPEGLVHLAFSVYLGWISVATIANATVVFYDLGWNGEPFSPRFWGAVMIAVAALLAVAMLWRRADAAFALVVAWALFGIAERQADLPVIRWESLVLAGILAILATGVVLRRRSPLSRTG